MSRHDKTTKIQKFKLPLKTLAAAFGVLSALVAPTLYSPKAAADAINNTDFVFTIDTESRGRRTLSLLFRQAVQDTNYIVDCNNDGVTEVYGQTASYI